MISEGMTSDGMATRWRAGFVLAVALAAATHASRASDDAPVRIKPVDPQFIAALGDPGAQSGTGAQHWGLWKDDPGPRGVALRNYGRLVKAGGVAPARWTFDGADWWLEENGLIMEKPQFPLLPGRYLVTGARGKNAVLTIHSAGPDGDRRWELDGGATLHDVTHLGCRSARYRPAAGPDSCTPARATQSAFPVAPGAAMPPVEGCRKQDYSVLIVIGVAEGG
jgi:hypothetical protein